MDWILEVRGEGKEAEFKGRFQGHRAGLRFKISLCGLLVQHSLLTPFITTLLRRFVPAPHLPQPPHSSTVATKVLALFFGGGEFGIWYFFLWTLKITMSLKKKKKKGLPQSYFIKANIQTYSTSSGKVWVVFKQTMFWKLMKSNIHFKNKNTGDPRLDILRQDRMTNVF